ncbi:MAG: hypothetical protein Tsb009_33560 [Planctomycetaceae bacterium]
MDSLVGTCVHHYECQSLLGAGGMGRVYLAHHKRLNRRCALKILSPRASVHDIDYVRRFRNEGQSTAALVHPNIVTVHAIGEADGHHFLEMEFISGCSLQQKLNREGRLMPLRATSLLRQIAEGLAAAHRNSILHRDLKPDNVLLTRHGLPKLADFGLAKRILQADPTEFLAGTPNYMAPEVLQGESATPASDVYALGVCYFQMLTGRVPFAGTSLVDLRREVTTAPIPNVREFRSDISLEMAECLSLLLAKSPRNRPRDGIEAAQLLDAISGKVRDLETLLHEAFQDHENVSWWREDEKYALNITLPDGRQQRLFLESSDHSTTERLLLIYSVCCPARPDYYADALRLNALVSHGGLALREIDGQDCFVMVDTYPRATVDPEEIRRSVLEVAFQADSVERKLTNRDRN